MGEKSKKKLETILDERIGFTKSITGKMSPGERLARYGSTTGGPRMPKRKTPRPKPIAVPRPKPKPRKKPGRITREDIEKYMKKKPREFQTGIPRLTKDKGPMQARPLPMTPELIKKAKDRMVPNPRAQQRDRSKPIIGKPMRRSSARRK